MKEYVLTFTCMTWFSNLYKIFITQAIIQLNSKCD